MRSLTSVVLFLVLPLVTLATGIGYGVEVAGGRCEAVTQGALSCILSQGGEVFLGFKRGAQGIAVRGLPDWASWVFGPKSWRDTDKVLRFRPPVGRNRATLELLSHQGSAVLVLSFEVIPARPRPVGFGMVLTWDDFRGEPPLFRTEEAAQIVYSLDLAYEVSLVSRNGGYFASLEHADLKISVLRERSWVHPWARNPAVLRHEQGHLDIAEAFRRLFLMKLGGLSCRGKTPEEAFAELRACVRELFDTTLSQLEKLQELYDRETGHGTDPVAQAAWEERITDWLLSPELLLSFIRKVLAKGP